MSAEFFVTRAGSQAHPRSFYAKLLQYIYKNPLGLSAYGQGLILEQVWHIIFGEEPYLKDLTIKECDLYNCKLQGMFKDRQPLSSAG